jgi:hypothetical protein
MSDERPAPGSPIRPHGAVAWRPGKLWSLREVMQTFKAHAALQLVSIIERHATINVPDDMIIPEDARGAFAAGDVSDDWNLGFVGVSASLKRLFEVMRRETSTLGEMKDICRELRGRLIDEVEARCVFILSARESEFYESPRKGWEISIERFPTISDDVEEAFKCFALSRYSAAVFHSTHLVETGLLELGKFLKVNDPHSGWTAVSRALKKVIDKDHKNRTRFEKKHFAFLEQVQGTVEGLKNAWRNKIGHAQVRLVLMTTDFSPEVAEEILFATRAFMRRLAEGLPKPKGGALVARSS